jgi:hypothetical protein
LKPSVVEGTSAKDAHALTQPHGAQERPAALELVQSGEDAELILDWKGDPMKLNPGDKLPFKFL